MSSCRRDSNPCLVTVAFSPGFSRHSDTECVKEFDANQTRSRSMRTALRKPREAEP